MWFQGKDSKWHQEKVYMQEGDMETTWWLHDFRSYINKYRASSQKDTSVEGYWKALKGALL